MDNVYTRSIIPHLENYSQNFMREGRLYNNGSVF